MIGFKIYVRAASGNNVNLVTSVLILRVVGVATLPPRYNLGSCHDKTYLVAKASVLQLPTSSTTA